MSTLKLPFLVIGFRRSAEIVEVLSKLAPYQPDRVYLAMDGPSSLSEEELTDHARKEAVKSIGWDCKLETYFADHNIGCAKFVTSALSWFFSSEEQGIILEDDIVIHQKFIEFVQFYHQMDCFSCICACTFESALFSSKSRPFNRPFSSWIPSIWGWYTRRDVWLAFQNHRRSKNPFVNYRLLRTRIGFWQSLIFAMCLDYIDRGLMDAWDYNFAFFMITSGRLSLFPPVQLSSNIGNSLLATNCQGDHQLTESLKDDVDFICSSPQSIALNSAYMRQQSMNTLMKDAYKIQALKHALKLVLIGLHLKFKNVLKYSKFC